MDAVMAAWLVEIGLIAVRDLGGNLPNGDTFIRRPPYPWELLGSAIIFGGLSVIAQNATARRPATALAWGLVAATFLTSPTVTTLLGGKEVPIPAVLKPVIDFLNGGYATPTSASGPGGTSNVPPAPGVSNGVGGTVSLRGGQQP